MIIGLVALLLLCPCLALAGWAVWQAGEDDEPTISAPATSAPAEPTGTPGVAPNTVQPSPSEEDDDFAKGDCVVNDGSDDDAELRKVPCGPKTYEVLLRIPATTDGDRCKTRAPQATANYVHDNSVDVLDYVLCLRERD
ncbi:LppU/SCO3897 family protein [Micromonospora phytophila]|uniref:LppU/SCO3897 family protein n=1 Tax=Micromonospora phytophila TaxID=709888 RepID=UPI0027E392EF|nr:hypothetical protein [Micromonospora phytophila]